MGGRYEKTKQAKTITQYYNPILKAVSNITAFFVYFLIVQFLGMHSQSDANINKIKLTCA